MKELASYAFSLLREGDIALYRGTGNGLAPILLVAAKETSLDCVERLQHELALKSELEADWAARPVMLTRYNDRLALVLEDPGGVPADRLLGRPLDVSHFLRIAIPLAGALRQVHERGLIHKDIKPANILVDTASGGVWLTGFGIASRLLRERPRARAARDHRRDPRLYGARTDRADEPLDRLPQRPLLQSGVTLLPDADGTSAVHGVRADGMGALPYRQEADAARRAVEEYTAPRSRPSS